MVPVPNLEYAADENPPTCKVLPVKRYEAEAVPWTSKTVVGAEPRPILKPAREMTQSASRVGVSEMAVKSKVSAVKSALSILEREFPVPLASKEMLVKAPSTDMSQSEVLIVPDSPLSPKLNKPLAYNALDAVNDLDTDNDPANELDAVDPFWVKMPDMEAAPPTSKEVSVLFPALIPKFPVVISNPVDEEAPAAIVMRPLKVEASVMTSPPAESMVMSPEVVPRVEPSIVSVSMVRTPVSDMVKTVAPLS